MNNPNLYAKANTVQKNLAIQIMKEYSHIFKWKSDGSDKFIDVGCGPGNVTNDIIIPYLPKNYKNIVGCDISKRMIEYAEQHKIDERSSFIELDIATEDLNLKDVGIYNNLSSFFCLQWVPNQKQALSNIYNLLQSDGSFLIVFVIKCSSYDIYSKLHKIPKWSKIFNESKSNAFMSPYNLFDHPKLEVEKLFREAGFSNFQTKFLNGSVIFENLSKIKEWLGGIFPFSPKASLEDQHECLEEAAKIALDLNMKVENGIEFYNKICICYGTK